MVSIKKLLIIVLVLSQSAHSMDCLKKYAHQTDANSVQVEAGANNIHIHNHYQLNKKGATLALLTITSLFAGLGVDISTIGTSAPTYEIQHALPYNKTLGAPWDRPVELTTQDFPETTAYCSQEEIEYYNQQCRYHYDAVNHTDYSYDDTNSTKRLIQIMQHDMARIKREQKISNRTCTNACSSTDNQLECLDLALRDNAVIIQHRTGRTDSNQTIFGLSIVSFFARVSSIILTTALGAKAAGFYE